MAPSVSSVKALHYEGATLLLSKISYKVQYFYVSVSPNVCPAVSACFYTCPWLSIYVAFCEIYEGVIQRFLQSTILLCLCVTKLVSVLLCLHVSILVGVYLAVLSLPICLVLSVSPSLSVLYVASHYICTAFQPTHYRV